MAEAEVTPPQIIPLDSGDTPTVKRIQLIDAQIHENPQAFIDALNKLGEGATENVRDLHDSEAVVTSLGTKPADLILEFFRNRYDAGSYDDTSEDLIAGSSEHRKLLEVMRSKTSLHVSTGIMASSRMPNPEANPARDAVRRSRFSLYLGRVSSYKTLDEKLETGNELPSTG